MSEAERSTTNTAIQKAIAILETIANDTRALSLPDIAEQLSLPRQTIHRVIKQLEELGLVVRDPGRERYRIGQRLNLLALATISNPHQNKTSHAVLQGLVDDVAETCNVGMLDGHEVIYIDRVECDWPLRVQLKAGSRVPVYCTAIGKLLLANQDAEARQHILSVSKLKRYTDNTITGSVKKWPSKTAQVYRAGYRPPTTDRTRCPVHTAATAMQTVAMPIRPNRQAYSLDL